MIWIFSLILGIALIIIADRLLYRFELISFIIPVFSIILIIFSVIGGIFWAQNAILYNGRAVKCQQTRIIFTNELEKYNDMRNKDITGSETYLKLQKQIVKFNYYVALAEKYDTFLLDNLLVDPAYRGIEPIEITDN